MKQLPLVISILVTALLIGGVVFFAGKGTERASQTNNVRIEGETQVIDISAKGGYTPKQSEAMAGVPTVIRVRTNGTYDCSSALRIPSLGFSTVMEPTGVTEITVPPQESGSTLEGVCAMGMYNFSVRFL